MKRTIRLTESDLHYMISEAVKTAINEIGDTRFGQYMLGRHAQDRYEKAKHSDTSFSQASLDAKLTAAKNNKNGNAGMDAFKQGATDQKKVRNANSTYNRECFKDDIKKHAKTYSSQMPKRRKKLDKDIYGID